MVTEENYQSQIHVSEVRDCSYMAAAYLKTDLFGHDAFVDVYVPYSDSPIYSAGGRAIRTEAHGLRVYATIVPGENAKAVVDARQQELAAKLFVAPSTISNYETGQRRAHAEFICKVADVFNVSTDYLLGRIEFRPPLAMINDEYVDGKSCKLSSNTSDVTQ